MKTKKLSILLVLVALFSLTLVGCETLDNAEYTLTVGVEGEGGSISIPDQENITSVVEQDFSYNTIVSLDTAADDGYVFDSWTGENSDEIVENDDRYEITINSNKEIYANFVEEGTEVEEEEELALEDFESYSLGDELSFVAWGDGDADAVIADDPLNPGNNVLEFSNTNYNAAPVIEITIPEGKTLADYSNFEFKGYFAEGDVGDKDIAVAVYNEEPNSEFDPESDRVIGNWFREAGESSEWENISITIEDSAEVTLSEINGSIFVAFGFSNSGSTWYADDVQFKE